MKSHLQDTLSNKKAKDKTVIVYDSMYLYKTKINPQKHLFNIAIFIFTRHIHLLISVILPKTLVTLFTSHEWTGYLKERCRKEAYFSHCAFVLMSYRDSWVCAFRKRGNEVRMLGQGLKAKQEYTLAGWSLAWYLEELWSLDCARVGPSRRLKV